MPRQLATVAIVVREYDEAIAWYTEKLGFTLIEDTPLGGEKRWVVVAPGDSGARILLARGVGELQQSRIGDQTGGRVFLFLETDDFQRDYDAFKARGVRFIRPIAQESYGVVSVFEDLYGNLWDLIEPR